MLTNTINNLISGLDSRRQEVINDRFGLNGSKIQTLEKLGSRHGITRERVRQIESEALNRLRERIDEKDESYKKIVFSINNHLRNNGGLRRDDIFSNEIKSILKDEKLNHWHLRLFSEISGEIFYYPRNDYFHQFWYLDENDISLLKKFLSELERTIANKRAQLINEGNFHSHLFLIVKRHGISDTMGINYVSVSKKFGINPFGDFGLSHWEEISPKTVREKSYLVLKKIGKPMHFREISESINKNGFDGKKALPQTVHNELIKDKNIILVGRGVYALKEHGYLPGTTREVIKQILKQKGPMPSRKLIENVLKQRILKENTILINLHNKNYFKRLSDGKYRLA